MKWYRTILRKTKLGKQTMEKLIFEHADNITRYSAPVDDFETQSCFLHFHKINELARCIHQLDVGCKELGHPANTQNITRKFRCVMQRKENTTSVSTLKVMNNAVEICHELTNDVNSVGSIRSGEV